MIKFKWYYDKDDEKVWLNQMSGEGWAMEGFFAGFYRFSRCKPGEYIYQIDLLDSWTGDSKDFTEFMDELNIEKVSQWWRWIFLRKKTEDGSFEMYTDHESIIAQYTRIRNFFKTISIVEILLCGLELFGFGVTGNFLLLIFAVLLGAIAIALSRIAIKCNQKVMSLREGCDDKQQAGVRPPWILCLGLLLNGINIFLQRFQPFPGGIYPGIVSTIVTVIAVILMVFGIFWHFRQNRMS